MSKPRVIKAFSTIEDAIKEQLRSNYPYGFDKYLISFKDTAGKIISALPYETEDRYYLIKMDGQITFEEMFETDTSEEDDIISEAVVDIASEEIDLEIEVEGEA